MPLTYVVEHLNRQLAELHRNSSLCDAAQFHYEKGQVFAEIGPLTLKSAIDDAVLGDKSKKEIRSAQLIAFNRGVRVGADFVYQLAWDAVDIVFVDRFVRTLHALNHIHEQHDAARVQALVLDVHWRHLCSVPDAHGQVFEQLLSTLGLSSGNIIFRIDGNALLAIERVQKAVSNFLECGYAVCAFALQLNPAERLLLESLGVRWVAGLGNQNPGHLIELISLPGAVPDKVLACG